MHPTTHYTVQRGQPNDTQRNNVWRDGITTNTLTQCGATTRGSYLDRSRRRLEQLGHDDGQERRAHVAQDLADAGSRLLDATGQRVVGRQHASRVHLHTARRPHNRALKCTDQQHGAGRHYTHACGQTHTHTHSRQNTTALLHALGHTCVMISIAATPSGPKRSRPTASPMDDSVCRATPCHPHPQQPGHSHTGTTREK